MSRGLKEIISRDFSFYLLNNMYLCHKDNNFSVMSYKNPKKSEYSTPKLTLYAVSIESGFALSLENPEYDPEQDW